MRKLLLDTHTLPWWLADAHNWGHVRVNLSRLSVMLSLSVRQALGEIAIKKALGKLEAPDDLDGLVENEGFDKLAIFFFHGERAGELPPLHRDPFDRMLVAQAQGEGLDIVTRDTMIAKYGVKTIDALSRLVIYLHAPDRQDEMSNESGHVLREKCVHSSGGRL